MAKVDIPTTDKQGRKVLIAMDGSKHAINAFEWYVENVFRDTDTVIMAHSAELGVNLPPLAQMGNPTAAPAMVREHDEEIKKVFKTIDELASKHNIKHTLERLHQPAGDAIVKAAKQHNVDFIIAGSRGHGTVRRTIMGSTSDYIIHHSHVPVFICKHEDEHHKLK